MKMAKRAGDTATYNSLASAFKEAQLEIGDALYVNAFLLLDAERKDDYSHIPWSSMVEFCREYGLTKRQRDDMVDYIVRIDSRITTERVKEANRRNARNGNGTTSGSQDRGHRRSRR